MTCIVGLKTKDNVFLGGDGAAVNSGYDLDKYIHPKVFKVNNFIIGYTTSFRFGQILEFSFKVQLSNTNNLYEYMCTTFIDTMRKSLKEGGYGLKHKDGEEKGGSILVGIENKLFKISPDFQVAESYLDYAAVGCGTDYAMASFYNNKDSLPYERLIKALETAEFFSAGVSKPFTVIETEKI